MANRPILSPAAIVGFGRSYRLSANGGSAKLIRSLLNYLRLPTKTLSIIGLVLASTIIVAGLAAWTWSDFSDVLADAETIVSSTSRAMDDVARSSLQADRKSVGA